MRIAISAALGVLTPAVLIQNAAFSSLEANRDMLEGMVARYVHAESWLGRAFPLTEIALTSDSWTIVWIVDQERCAECSSDLENWNALVRAGLVHAEVILSAEDRDPPLTWISSLEFSGLRSLPGTLEEQFRVPASSLRLLLDPNGVIVDVDARRPDGTCRWSFAAKVDLLLEGGLGLPFHLIEGAP